MQMAFLWHINYPLTNGKHHLTIATTRPETMLGDSALMVHPDDERYKEFVGQKVFIPLIDREIPIIADDYVDPTFGTGVVKVTPAHDFNDYAVGQRHNLPLINILTLDGNINENGTESYEGLERFVARKKIIADLKDKSYLAKIEKHALKIPRGDRTGTVIEPMLTDQWYVAMTKNNPSNDKSIAQEALDVVKQGDIKFYPQNWVNTYNQWLENIQDWCISRQLWWGHQIPAWYGDNQEVFVAHSLDEAKELAKKEGYQGKLKRDEDVLDTWFSSALWPFSTLDWTP
jgi:valyl-tRNA synthetase